MKMSSGRWSSRRPSTSSASIAASLCRARGVNIVRRANDMIFLYRRPLLDYWCETGEPLFDIVRHVVIHEIGHHFGFSDDDMENIETTTE